MATTDSQNFPHIRDANGIVTYTRDGRLDGVPVEELHAWRAVMNRCRASAAIPDFSYALERITDELNLRAQDKRHQEALEAHQKLHGIQIVELRKLSDESSAQGHKQHKETQHVARKAYYAAVVGVIIALIALLFEIIKSIIK